MLGWSPAVPALLREAPIRSAYGAWCRTLLFVIGTALSFDLRDASATLHHVITGHPALG